LPVWGFSFPSVKIFNFYLFTKNKTVSLPRLLFVENVEIMYSFSEIFLSVFPEFTGFGTRFVERERERERERD